MSKAFYPFVDNGRSTSDTEDSTLVVRQPARIAVFDDEAAAPRVVVVEPSDIRTYLEEITETVTRLAAEQGGRIPFTVIREVVENLIHAYFMEPTVSILDGGNTIRFADQGPGIEDKERALQYGTTSATAEMKVFIRGVGSGLPYAQQWLEGKGGSLTVDDNIHNGTVVTISLAHPSSENEYEAETPTMPAPAQMQQPVQWPQAQAPQQPYQGQPYQGQPYPPQPWQQPYPAQPYQPYPAQPQPYQQPMVAQATPGMWQTPYPQQGIAPTALSERGAMILDYLRYHDSVGPRDLNAINPLSESTWSRELVRLEDLGLIAKQGRQKRSLTPAGRQFLGLP